MILTGIGGALALAAAAGASLQQTVFKKRRDGLRPYGQLIEVADGRMHVHVAGQGEKTVVLLPGMGVALPSADFGPLMRRLSETFKVACVEYFGTGFSSETKRPRTAANYAEEIRAALSGAGLAPPYILMPHSISGVYAEYYAARYPEEVEALICLDGTSTASYEEMPAFVRRILPVVKFQQRLGLFSLLARVTANRKKLLDKGYTKAEIGDLIAFAGFAVNDGLLKQMAGTAEAIRMTGEAPFPASVPYVKVISSSTYAMKKSQLKMDPKEYQRRHLERIGPHARSEVLSGTHFIYLDQGERIAQIARETAGY